MNGVDELFVTLTCHGNAFLRGIGIPRFFPGNKACQFCEFIRFHDGSTVTATPDDWFARLRSMDVRGLVLTRVATNDPNIPDRMSAGFVGGGGTAYIESLGPDGMSVFWTGKWTVGNQDAEDNRIWQVEYAADHRVATQAHKFRSLLAIEADFEKALSDIHAFSSRQIGEDGFTACFAAALKVLRDVNATDHQDSYLYPSHTLSESARRLLAAAGPAWVFGGMGSWNDLGFDRKEDQEEYDRVSEALFDILNEAVAAAASSSWEGSGL